MRTKQTDRLPEIVWERSDELIDRHDHECHYVAYGESADGRTWTGTCIEIDGEFEEVDVDSIERA